MNHFKKAYKIIQNLRSFHLIPWQIGCTSLGMLSSVRLEVVTPELSTRTTIRARLSKLRALISNAALTSAQCIISFAAIDSFVGAWSMYGQKGSAILNFNPPCQLLQRISKNFWARSLQMLSYARLPIAISTFLRYPPTFNLSTPLRRSSWRNSKSTKLIFLTLMSFDSSQLALSSLCRGIRQIVSFMTRCASVLLMWNTFWCSDPSSSSCGPALPLRFLERITFLDTDSINVPIPSSEMCTDLRARWIEKWRSTCPSAAFDAIFFHLILINAHTLSPLIQNQLIFL